MPMRRRRRRRLRVVSPMDRELDLSAMAPFLLEGDRIESMLTGPELLRLCVRVRRVTRRGCVNKTLCKSVHREDVWLRSLKQDSEEDRRVVLMNEWAEKKWKMMCAVEEKESGEEEKEEENVEEKTDKMNEDKDTEKDSEEKEAKDI